MARGHIQRSIHGLATGVSSGWTLIVDIELYGLSLERPRYLYPGRNQAYGDDI